MLKAIFLKSTGEPYIHRQTDHIHRQTGHTPANLSPGEKRRCRHSGLGTLRAAQSRLFISFDRLAVNSPFLATDRVEGSVAVSPPSQVQILQPVAPNANRTRLLQQLIRAR